MSLALRYWMGDAHHCSGPPSPKYYTVSSGTLNSIIPHHTRVTGTLIGSRRFVSLSTTLKWPWTARREGTNFFRRITVRICFCRSTDSNKIRHAGKGIFSRSGVRVSHDPSQGCMDPGAPSFGGPFIYVCAHIKQPNFQVDQTRWGLLITRLSKVIWIDQVPTTSY